MTELAFEMSCNLCHRVVIASANRMDCIQALVMHRTRRHPKYAHVLSEGEDFTLVPAPTRCDLCGVLAERPWWEYRTIAGAAEDDAWLVCDGCHAVLLRRKPLRPLVERTLRQQRQDLALDFTSPSEHQRTVTGAMRSFLEHLDGEPVRELP